MSDEANIRRIAAALAGIWNHPGEITLIAQCLLEIDRERTAQCEAWLRVNVGSQLETHQCAHRLNHPGHHEFTSEAGQTIGWGEPN